MTRLKYDELYGFAVLVRNHKNLVSKQVNDNLFHYLDCNKFAFLKEMRDTYKGVVSSSFDWQLYTEVLVCYQNKFDALQRKLKFEVCTFKGIELYKRDTKKNRKGSLKRVVNDRKQTRLSNCLTYLARYGNEGTLDYIRQQMQCCELTFLDNT